MNLVKVGNVIVNLNLVYEVHISPDQVVVFYPFPDIGNQESPMYNVFEGAEADALRAFLEDAATDTAAWLEVEEEDAPLGDPMHQLASLEGLS